MHSNSGRPSIAEDVEGGGNRKKGRMKMCGRFYVDDDTAREIERIAGKINRETAKPGDVHPSEPALVLRASGTEIGALLLRWGYEAAGKGGVIFNARSETVQEKPMFRYDYETHRCVVPAKKFYEWKRLGTKQKEKYEFFSPGKILFLAGIYHRAPEGDRFTILTREAEGCMVEVHNRMPLILTAGDIEKWLFSREEAGRLLDSHFEGLRRKRSDSEEYRQLSLFQ